MYAFDYGNAHFVILNQYFDGKSDVGGTGDVVDDVFNWLKQDLESTKKKYVFVIGHEPAFPLADMENYRMRHPYDCLNQYPENRDRFWKYLKSRNITAYFCGHTHNTSVAKIDNVYQVDVGHARGMGDQGASSTFVKVYVQPTDCRFEIYRDDSNGGPYRIVYHGSFLK